MKKITKKSNANDKGFSGKIQRNIFKFNKCLTRQISPETKGFSKNDVTLGQIYSKTNDTDVDVNAIVLNANCDVISVAMDEKQIHKYALFKNRLSSANETSDSDVISVNKKGVTEITEKNDIIEEIDKISSQTINASITSKSGNFRLKMQPKKKQEAFKINENQASKQRKYIIPLKLAASTPTLSNNVTHKNDTIEEINKKTNQAVNTSISSKTDNFRMKMEPKDQNEAAEQRKYIIPLKLPASISTKNYHTTNKNDTIGGVDKETSQTKNALIICKNGNSQPKIQPKNKPEAFKIIDNQDSEDRNFIMPLNLPASTSTFSIGARQKEDIIEEVDHNISKTINASIKSKTGNSQLKMDSDNKPGKFSIHENQDLEQRKYIMPVKLPSSTSALSNDVTLERSHTTLKTFKVPSKSMAADTSLNNLVNSKSFDVFSRGRSPPEIDTVKTKLPATRTFPYSIKTSSQNNTIEQNKNTKINFATNSGKSKEINDNASQLVKNHKMIDQAERSFPIDDDSIEYSPSRSLTSLLSLNSEDCSDNEEENADVSLTKSIGSEMSVDHTNKSLNLAIEKGRLSVDSHLKIEKSISSPSENFHSSTVSIDHVNKNTEIYAIKSNLVQVKDKHFSTSVDNLLETTGISNSKFVTRNSVSIIKNDPNWNKFLNKLDQIIVNKSSEIL